MLKPLSKRQICVFTKVIDNDLDWLNHSKTVILFDQLIIRKYHDSDVGLDFSFIKDLKTDSMYFVALPELEDWIFSLNKNYVPYGETYRLKDKVSLVEFDNLLLRKFIDNSEGLLAKEMSFDEKYFHLSLLYREILSGYFLLRASPNDPIPKLDSLYLESRITDYELEKIKAMLAVYLGEDFRLEVFKIFNLGYVAFIFHENGTNQKFTSKIYFIPSDTRDRIMRGTDSPNQDSQGCPDN